LNYFAELVSHSNLLSLHCCFYYNCWNF